ncbi:MULTISPECIES: VOC family protein [Streptomyces]|uniref:VOC family protein n=1 Tax=Streptomyces lycii TaxID=2654337 RepID=A0ABQ7FKP7_9ACTN|nr:MULTISPECIES: VOC family protein [Streptomyces]KAF4409247.1 VOC family protein [Streptomyces lycii]PGH47484.1 hydrolase [Streptomyces sp. Ru87]
MAPFAEGVPCWADVMLPDLEAGKRFYGELFGWTFEDDGADHAHYTEALLDGRKAAALAPKPDGRMPTAWGVYLATADASRAAARIRTAGGRLVSEPVTIDGFGVMTHAVDPGGAVFGLWQSGRHQGFEVQGLPGSYAWTEVYTRDKAAVDPFYGQVFGYAMEDIDAGDDFDFRLWSPAGSPPGEDTAIGGRCVMDDRFPEAMPAHYLVYFAVADCDDAVRTVTRLGGRATAEPVDSPYGRFSIVVDDQGANFAVLAPAEDPGAAPG